MPCCEHHWTLAQVRWRFGQRVNTKRIETCFVRNHWPCSALGSSELSLVLSWRAVHPTVHYRILMFLFVKLHNQRLVQCVSPTKPGSRAAEAESGITCQSESAFSNWAMEKYPSMRPLHILSNCSGLFISIPIIRLLMDYNKIEYIYHIYLRYVCIIYIYMYVYVYIYIHIYIYTYIIYIIQYFKQNYRSIVFIPSPSPSQLPRSTDVPGHGPLENPWRLLVIF